MLNDPINPKFKDIYSLGLDNIPTPIPQDVLLDPNVRNKLDVQLSQNIRKSNEINSKKFHNPFSRIDKSNFKDTLDFGLYGVNAFLSFNEENQNDSATWDRMRNVFTQKNLYDYNAMNPNPQPIIKAKDGAKIKNLGYGNVEGEGGEIVKLPNGTFKEFSGPSHEQGGVKTILPNNSEIHSDTIILPSDFVESLGLGKKEITPAKALKKLDIENISKTIEDPYMDAISKNTAKLNMKKVQTIFSKQQELNNNSTGKVMENGGILKYPDGGRITLYRGDTNAKWNAADKLTDEQVNAIADKYGFKPDVNSKENVNVQFQKFLYNNVPGAKEKIDILHGGKPGGYGTPAITKKMFDGNIGVRWQEALLGLDSPTPQEPPTGSNTPITKVNPPTYTKPLGNTVTKSRIQNQTPSTLGEFPMFQMLPEVSGFLSAMNTYPYYTPDYTHNELQSPTLNIQPQLESIDSSFQSGIRQNTGNGSINNSRNTAMFNQTLQAKQQAFGNKQNYDANSRFRADEYNANARTQENVMDLNAAMNVYNEYRASAKDAASTERNTAISNGVNKYAKYQQDEFRKAIFFDTMLPDYYYDGKDKSNPIKKDSLYVHDFTPGTLTQYLQNKNVAKKKK